MTERCHYCGCGIDPEDVVRYHEFDKDGVYCSKDCLRKQMKEYHHHHDEEEEDRQDEEWWKR